MEGEGVPSKIDKYFLSNMAGGTQNHFRHALRSLGLIDDEDRSTDALQALVSTPDQRKAMFGELLRERFPRLVELDINASKSDFISVLEDAGMKSSETQRKAIGFYVAAAEYAGIPVSNHVKSGRSPSPSRRVGARRKPNSASSSGNSAEPSPTTPLDVLTDDAMRSAYFKLLAKKAEAAEDPSDLFDRIERLVRVVDGDKKQNRGRKTSASKPETPPVPDSQAEG
jgi:hypothetical protein